MILYTWKHNSKSTLQMVSSFVFCGTVFHFHYFWTYCTVVLVIVCVWIKCFNVSYRWPYSKLFYGSYLFLVNIFQILVWFIFLIFLVFRVIFNDYNVYVVLINLGNSIEFLVYGNANCSRYMIFYCFVLFDLFADDWIY